MSTGRTVKNTDHVSPHDWPDDMLVQGGGDGIVLSRGPGGHYRTAFVEAFPGGTFLRGEGKTVADADDACWAQYQRLNACEHGPYEPRNYTNGCGFCVKCGMWFTDVCEPAKEVKVEREAIRRVKERYGADLPMMPQWHGLMFDEIARIYAAEAGEPEPAPTTEPPTEAEWAKAREPWDPEVLYDLLRGLADKGDQT